MGQLPAWRAARLALSSEGWLAGKASSYRPTAGQRCACGTACTCIDVLLGMGADSYYIASLGLHALAAAVMAVIHDCVVMLLPHTRAVLAAPYGGLAPFDMAVNTQLGSLAVELFNAGWLRCNGLTACCC